jgi:hypothetical protein
MGYTRQERTPETVKTWGTQDKEDKPETVETWGTQDKKGQTRDSGNIGYI